MSNTSIFNDKINIKIIDPGVVIRMCSFVKETLGKRDDLIDKHAIKRQFDNLVKEYRKIMDKEKPAFEGWFSCLYFDATCDKLSNKDHH